MRRKQGRGVRVEFMWYVWDWAFEFWGGYDISCMVWELGIFRWVGIGFLLNK